jgi:AraC-like DNA-binding protein
MMDRTHRWMWEEDIAEAVRLRKQGWSFRDIADRVGFGQTTVAARVKAVLGETPRSNSARLDEAEKLLAKGKTLAWVAEYLGYEDRYGMSRMIADRHGGRCTPKSVSEKVIKGALLYCEGKSWQQIADACGYVNRQSARSSVVKHMERKAKRGIRESESAGCDRREQRAVDANLLG